MRILGPFPITVGNVLTPLLTSYTGLCVGVRVTNLSGDLLRVEVGQRASWLFAFTSDIYDTSSGIDLVITDVVNEIPGALESQVLVDVAYTNDAADYREAFPGAYPHDVTRAVAVQNTLPVPVVIVSGGGTLGPAARADQVGWTQSVGDQLVPITTAVHDPTGMIDPVAHCFNIVTSGLYLVSQYADFFCNGVQITSRMRFISHLANGTLDDLSGFLIRDFTSEPNNTDIQYQRHEIIHATAGGTIFATFDYAIGVVVNSVVSITRVA